MTFDVHQLDTFLLVGAGVTLLAILAVRVSVAGRPAEPADLPADGGALGEAASASTFDDASWRTPSGSRRWR